MLQWELLQICQRDRLRPQPGGAPASGRCDGVWLHQRQLLWRVQETERIYRHPGQFYSLTAGASSVKSQPKLSYHPWNEAINHIISLAFVLYLYTWYLSELLVYNVKGKPVKYCKTDIFCKWFLAACCGQKKFNPPSRLSLLYKGKGAFRIRFLKFYWSWGFQVWKLAKYSDKLSKYENRF